MLNPVVPQALVPQSAEYFVAASENVIKRELGQIAEISRRVNAVLLRDTDPAQHSRMIELDFLVATSEMDRLAAQVSAVGYTEKKAFWCRPHRFFIKFDQTSGTWFKLDVLTELWFGYKTRWLRIDHLGCLRWRSDSAPFYRLSPEHEFTILLLRAILSKGKPSPARAARILELSKELELSHQSSATASLVSVLTPALSGGNPNDILNRAPRNAYRSLRRAIGWNLFWSEATGNLRRLAWTTAARVIRPFVTAFHNQGCLVALVGPDGAGKSTAAQTLRNDPELRARTFYTGLYPKARRAGNGSSGTASRAWNYLRRLAHLRYTLCAARWQKLRGRVVVLDRYVCDSWINTKSGTLFQRLRLRLLNWGWPTPDLVILLDAPAHVLFDRKHEHTLDWLEEQRQLYASVAAKLPRFVAIDTNQSISTVQHEIVNLVWNIRRSTV